MMRNSSLNRINTISSHVCASEKVLLTYMQFSLLVCLNSSEVAVNFFVLFHLTPDSFSFGYHIKLIQYTFCFLRTYVKTKYFSAMLNIQVPNIKQSTHLRSAHTECQWQRPMQVNGDA